MNDNHNSHDHHDHGHATPTSLSTAFLVAIFLNIVFVVVELYYGYSSNSIALVADATHNFGDVIGLVLGFVTLKLSSKIPSKTFTFGLKSSTILSTLVSSSLLLMATGGIIFGSIQKIFRPEIVQGQSVIIVALVGVFINGISAYLLSKDQKDLNVKSAFLHLFSDTLVSVGVVISGVLILVFGFVWIDAVVSLFIGLIILRSTVKVLQEALNLSLQAVPSAVDYEKIKSMLGLLDGIDEIHDLHIWAMSTSENALTCHLVLSDGAVAVDLISLSEKLEHEYNIAHSTIQVETIQQRDLCELRSDLVV